mgnify:FL=1
MTILRVLQTIYQPLILQGADEVDAPGLKKKDSNAKVPDSKLDTTIKVNFFFILLVFFSGKHRIVDTMGKDLVLSCLENFLSLKEDKGKRNPDINSPLSFFNKEIISEL